MTLKKSVVLEPKKLRLPRSSKVLHKQSDQSTRPTKVYEDDDELGPLPRDLWPKVDHLITEDDTPVDNFFSEKQQKLGTTTLHDSPNPFGKGRKFIAVANVGLYISPDETPQVPDIMVSLDVSLPKDLWEKGNRTYLIWLFGKPPEVVIEIVSNTVGAEDGKKKQKYALMRIAYYVIYDPEQQLSKQTLRIYELRGTEYVLRKDHWVPGIGLGLVLWHGVYEEHEDTWLRWCDKEGNLLLSGKERAEQEQQRAEQEHQRADQEQQRADQEQRAEQEHQRADQEQQRADQEQQRADQEQQRAEQEQQRAEQERQRAELLAAKLRTLGIDPDSLSIHS